MILISTSISTNRVLRGACYGNQGGSVFFGYSYEYAFHVIERGNYRLASQANRKINGNFLLKPSTRYLGTPKKVDGDRFYRLSLQISSLVISAW